MTYDKGGGAMGEVENKVAVITGGASGIGKCIADEFRKNGAKVSVIDKATEGTSMIWQSL